MKWTVFVLSIQTIETVFFSVQDIVLPIFERLTGHLHLEKTTLAIVFCLEMKQTMKLCIRIQQKETFSV